jgi:hypothetical protein
MKNACRRHRADSLKLNYVSSLDESKCLLSSTMDESMDESNFNHALDRAYFHIRGEKNPRNMTQPSLTFLHSALSITEQRKEN